MKVIDKTSDNFARLKDLESGDVFVHFGKTYIALGERLKDCNGDSFNALGVDGTYTLFINDALKVQRVKATLTIE